MIKAARHTATTDAEIARAIARAHAFAEEDPKVVFAEYQHGVDLIAMHFSNGMIVALPRKLLQGLREATPAQLEHIQIMGHGTGLHWPELDVDHYVLGLLGGVFGTQKWMAEIGRKGGSANSKKKVSAARANGRLGGRPAKRTAAAV